MSEKETPIADRLAQALNPQVGKVVKDMTTMFKTMTSGSVIDLLITFAEAMGLMEPFKAIFDLIMGLFQVMGAQILPVLMDVLKPLMDILMQLMPVFAFIGKLIATLLSVALIPLQVFFEVLSIVLKPLTPLLEPLGDALDALKEPLKVLVHILVNVVMAALKTVANGFIIFINIIIGVINFIANIFTFGAFPDIPLIPLIAYQEGTDYVPRTGPALVHQGESIMSAGQRNEMVSLLASIDEGQKQMIANDEARKRFARGSKI
jgi:hypothetical protein